MSQDLASSLPDWLPRQRWFGDKSRTIEDSRVLDTLELGGEALRLVEVRFEQGPASLYQVGGAGDKARQRWWELLQSRAGVRGAAGRFQFDSWSELETAGWSRLVGAEQSNTSWLYHNPMGEVAAILKLFRRLQAGENPEIEIPRALTRAGKFRQVPLPLGEARYTSNAGESYVLAALQSYVPNAGDGWSHVLQQLAAGKSLEPELHALGRRTAELHAALADISSPAFAPEPITAADVEIWRQRALAGLAAPALHPYEELLAPWRAQLDAGAAEATLGGRQHRLHGDYHLGQVLRTLSGDWVVIDFEGEPARPMAERRRKGSPLQDVAGLLRSLGYAAFTAKRAGWEAMARAAFLAGYTEVAGPVPEAAVRFFEMEKAVYELSYELAHRPDWVAIPLAGIRALVTESPC